MTHGNCTDVLERLTIVLSRPAYAGNVGAVARVMANFGVRRGILVAPRCDVNSLEARQYATGNSSVILATLESAKTLSETVSEKLRDATTVIAVTRRTGQMRQPSIAIQDIAGRLRTGKVTLVFGPEESGLTDEDVQLCTNILTLDVSQTMPSLNLSHAVAVVLSHIFKQISDESQNSANILTKNAMVGDPGNPSSYSQSRSSLNVILAGDFQNLSRRLLEVLRLCEASERVANADRLSRILSQTLARANLDASELAAWHGLISAFNT